ncbi:hypothetical protein N7512_004185 [Penicillium capsulatum]|nr:hypothetical protein N7512_004185 [Penicillium capsulatum]
MTFSDTGWARASPGVSVTPEKKGRTRQTGTPWTRSGCLTCKRRRKGCDKAKPSCNNCIKQGRTCEGYGSIWADPLGPGAKVFNPRETSSKRRRLSVSPSSDSISPLQSPCWDVSSDMQSPPGTVSGWFVLSSPQPRIIEDIVPTSRHEKTTDDQNETDIYMQVRQELVPRPHAYPSHLSSNESHYLQYHVEHGSKLLANLESDDNPLRSLLIPRSMSSPLLMKAVCAVSALHLANRSHHFDAQTAAADYYGRALGGIRTALAESSTDSLSDDAMLAVGLMCKYEVVRGSVSQWVVHLNALQRLIASRGGLISMDRDAAEFLRGLYVYAYNMARISNRKCLTATESCPSDTDIGPPRLDIYIGYTEEILKLCARIAELPSLEGDTVSLRLAIAAINDSLMTWSHASIPYMIPHGLSPASLVRLHLVAECFRDAAFVYVHSILERMSMASNNASIHTPSVPDWALLISTPKSTAVHRCLSRVETFPLDDHCEYSALTFPLFIAGCESNTLAQRELALRSLGKLQNNFGIGNVRRAKDVLGILWTRRDALDPSASRAAESSTRGVVHWLDILEELQWELILA